MNVYESSCNGLKKFVGEVLMKSIKYKVSNVFRELKELGNEKMRALASRRGAEEQFGANLGDIRKIAKKIRIDHDLALELWASKNLDARLLAILIMKIQNLSPAELEKMIASLSCVQEADWFNAYIVRKYPENGQFREDWLNADNPMIARSGWDLTAEGIQKHPDDFDPCGLLDRIEAEILSAPPEAQWTMNNTLVAIGVNVPKYRERALEIGERMGLYSDYPVSRGCTSPFAPIWIAEMVKRQEKDRKK